MITWSQFYPYVNPEAPGAPTPLVDHVLRKAAIEFCQESGLHTIDAADIDVVAGTATYALDPGDTELSVCMVRYAWLAQKKLGYVSQEVLNNDLTVYWPATTADLPVGFTQQDPDSIILYPIPNLGYTGTDALKIKLTVRPSLTSTGVYDWIGNRYIQEIAFGALAMLCAMPNKGWTNADTETKYRKAFEAAKTKATIDAYRSFTRAPLQIAKSANW